MCEYVCVGIHVCILQMANPFLNKAVNIKYIYLVRKAHDFYVCLWQQPCVISCFAVNLCKFSSMFLFAAGEAISAVSDPHSAKHFVLCLLGTQ